MTDTLRTLLARLRGMLRRQRTDADLDAEIRFHLEREAALLVERGLAPDAAYRAARLAFGPVEAMKERHRDDRGIPMFETLGREIGLAARAMRMRPALHLALVSTLALAIGATGAIYSAVDAVILRPLPLPAPDRLMLIGEDNPDFQWHQADAAPANFIDWRAETTRFSGMTAYSPFANHATLTGLGDPQILNVAVVAGNFFDVIGVGAQLGRTLLDNETWSGGAPTTVLSHRFWISALHGDPSIVGRTLILDGAPVRVVGVMPAGFSFPVDDIDLWQPPRWDAAARSQIWFRRAHFVKVIGRLAPGVTLPEANADLQRVVTRLQRDYPETNRVMGATMTPLQQYLARDLRVPLLLLLSAVAFLLLIACANIGNLLLLDAISRQRETSLRVALGAGRARLARQCIVHALLVALVGGIIGACLAWCGVHALLAIAPASVLPERGIAIDGRVLLVLFAIAAVAGVLFGLFPAFWAAVRAPADVLREGGRAHTGGGSHRIGRALIVTEIALATVLAIGAGLMLRSFLDLNAVRPGFDASGVVAIDVSIPSATYDSASRITSFFDRLQQQARAIPGVQSAAIVSSPPLTSFAWSSQFSIAGRAPLDASSDVVHREVSPDYFNVMRVPLERGRFFTAADGLGTPRVVLINDEVAHRYFAGTDPVGQRISFDRVPDSTSTWRTIVGVVGTEHQAGPELEPRPEFFAPAAQDFSRDMTLMVRTMVDPTSIAPAVRRIIAGLDPTLAVGPIRTMAAVRRASVARHRFLLTLLLGFATTGMMLAAVGVYGVISHLTRSRQRELGIRVALGARPDSLHWLMVGRGMNLAVLGTVLGLGIATFAGRLIGSLLYGVTAGDPITFVGTGAVLLLVAGVASWLPARRAARADPMTSLRID